MKRNLPHGINLLNLIKKRFEQGYMAMDAGTTQEGRDESCIEFLKSQGFFVGKTYIKIDTTQGHIIVVAKDEASYRKHEALR